MSPETQFKDYWASAVYPAIQADFERLLQTTPKRIAEKRAKEEQKAASKKTPKKASKRAASKTPKKKPTES